MIPHPEAPAPEDDVLPCQAQGLTLDSQPGVNPNQDDSAQEVSRFLSHLAVAAEVSAATENPAPSALLFLYRKVLCMNIEWVEGVVRAKRPARLPVVLTWMKYGLCSVSFRVSSGLCRR